MVTARPNERAGAAWQTSQARHQRLVRRGTPSVLVSRAAGAQSDLMRTAAPLFFSDTQAAQGMQDALLPAAASHSISARGRKRRLCCQRQKL